MSWDTLNRELTPALAAAGYLVKDDLGRWTVTPHGRAAVSAS